MLDGRHALVTGGGTGIGAAIALALARAGARVTITGRREAPLSDIAAQSERIAWRQMDVTDETAITKTIAEIEPIDILVANAGLAETSPIHKQTLDHWRRIQAVNVEGPMICTREALPGMRDRSWGRLVYISSIQGLKGARYVSAYAASKHALCGLMRCVAEETLGTGVTANALCPGYVNTDIVDVNVTKIMERSGLSAEDALGVMRDANPIGRLIEPEEIAEAVLWLCGPGSGAVTAQAIAISGGQI